MNDDPVETLITDATYTLEHIEYDDIDGAIYELKSVGRNLIQAVSAVNFKVEMLREGLQ